MSNFSIPYSFIAGTKAKAEEVNANFEAIQSELALKAGTSGSETNRFKVADAICDDEAVSKSQMMSSVSDIETQIDNVKNSSEFGKGFQVVSGFKNDENKPDLFDIEDNTKIVFKVDDNISYKPIICSLASGERFQLNSISDFRVNALSDGENNVFVNKQGEIVAFKNKIFKCVTMPTDAVINDIWLDTSEKPYVAKKYNGSTYEVFNYVHLPQSIIVESGLVTEVKILNNYGANGYNDAAFELLDNGVPSVIESYENDKSWYRIWSNGLLEQGFYIEDTTVTSDTRYYDLLKPFNDDEEESGISSYWGIGGSWQSYAIVSFSWVTNKRIAVHSLSHNGSASDCKGWFYVRGYMS